MSCTQLPSSATTLFAPAVEWLSAAGDSVVADPVAGLVRVVPLTVLAALWLGALLTPPSYCAAPSSRAWQAVALLTVLAAHAGLWLGLVTSADRVRVACADVAAADWQVASLVTVVVVLVAFVHAWLVLRRWRGTTNTTILVVTFVDLAVAIALVVVEAAVLRPQCGDCATPVPLASWSLVVAASVLLVPLLRCGRRRHAASSSSSTFRLKVPPFVAP